MPGVIGNGASCEHGGIIFVGDIHQNWQYVETGLADLPIAPRAAVLLGDIECVRPLDELAAPLLDRGVAVYWIHGNHEHDAGAEMWANLTAAERNPLTASGALHARVVDITGIRIAGLGGAFLPHVWPANAAPRLHHRDQIAHDLALNHPDLRPAQAAVLTQFLTAAAIWPEDIDALRRQQADILVSHEAPSSHPEGARILDELARAMGARLIVHGHHHITSEARTADGLRVLSVGAAWAVDLNGGVVWRGARRDRPIPRAGEGWLVRAVTG